MADDADRAFLAAFLRADTFGVVSPLPRPRAEVRTLPAEPWSALVPAPRAVPGPERLPRW